MRRIKFRAWDAVDEEMIWADNPIDVLPLDPNDTDLLPMQYTGLKDKNGVEIYEGDIMLQPVDWSGHGGGHRKRTMERSVISWYSEEARFINLWNPSEGEVVGNIYEHPERLKDAA